MVFSPFLYHPVPRKKIRTFYFNFDYFELDVQRDEIEMKRIMRPNFCLYFNKTFSRHGNHGKHGKHGKYLLALPWKSHVEIRTKNWFHFPIHCFYFITLYVEFKIFLCLIKDVPWKYAWKLWKLLLRVPKKTCLFPKTCFYGTLNSLWCRLFFSNCKYWIRWPTFVNKNH